MKKFMLREGGRSSRYFDSYDAAKAAMEERIEYWKGKHAIIVRRQNNRVEFLSDRKNFIAIREFEVEG